MTPDDTNAKACEFPHELREMGPCREQSESRDIKMQFRYTLQGKLSLNLLFRWRHAYMASTSHDHSALRPYTVQLVCGSPSKQGKQVVNTDRSFLDVFEALEWSKGVQKQVHLSTRHVCAAVLCITLFNPVNHIDSKLSMILA